MPQLQAALDDTVWGGESYGPTGFREFQGPPGKVEQLPYSSVSSTETMCDGREGWAALC